MSAGAVLSLLYVFAAPVFSAFRLELAFVPMAAYGIALGMQVGLERLFGTERAAEPLAARAQAHRASSPHV